MSESKEKKVQPEAVDREEKRRQEEETSRRNKVIYTIIGVVAAVLVAALLIWDSGLLQKQEPAVTIDGQDFMAADLLYYYSIQYENAYQYGAYGLSNFNGSVDPEEQIYDEATGQTWHEYFQEQAVEGLKTYVAIQKEGESKGHVLSQSGQDGLQANLDDLKSAQLNSGYRDLATYLKSVFGSAMTEDTFRACLEREAYVHDYMNTVQEEYTYSDQELKEYYQKNADAMDSFNFDQLTFRASVNSYDEEGKAIELTEEEEKAQLDQAKKEMAALAQEAKTKLDAGTSMEELAELYEEQLYSVQLDTVRLGSDLNTTLSDWFLAEGRQAGDTTLAEFDGGALSYSYYLVELNDRYLDQSATSDVRHILVDGENAKADAQALLDSWKAGETTEDSFAQLAVEKSQDRGSAANGGLITGITPTSLYVENFLNWSVDTGRKVGDTGIVESEYGAHVMYFNAWGDPVWKLTAESALLNEDLSLWIDEQVEKVEAQVGPGMEQVEKF